MKNNNNILYEINENKIDLSSNNNDNNDNDNNNCENKLENEIILNTDNFCKNNGDNVLDAIYAKQVYYCENYILPDLKKIADYYEISYRKFRKDELVQEIVLFENDVQNYEKVYQRLKFWKYIEELKEDKFFKSLIIF